MTFHFLQISGEVVRLLETDGDFLVRETVRNDEKQIVLSVRTLFSFYGIYIWVTRKCQQV